MNETLTRLLSGIVYIILLFYATLTSPVTFFIFFSFVLFVCVYEFKKLIHLKSVVVYPITALLMGFHIFFIYKNVHDFDWAFISLSLFVSILLMMNLKSNKTLYLDRNFKFVLLIGYVIFPFLILTALPFTQGFYDYKIIFVLFVLIWTNDTFAYVVGKSIGKRKLFPSVSPKKTVEGFFGGFVFTILASIIMNNIMQLYSTVFLILMSVIVSVFGTIGDLVESKFKRTAQVKDSGKIMPGHGGILDRFDSVIFVAPFILLLLKIITYVS
ncbi:MAG: phosphatidate cytidylyltransferase [Flavobacterium sp.]